MADYSEAELRFAAEYTALNLVLKAMVLTHPFPDYLKECLKMLYEAGTSGATPELLPSLDAAVLGWVNAIPEARHG